jgi:SEL1 protein
MDTVSPRFVCISTRDFLGLNTAQDFHLAKRHYDFALDTNIEAYLPVTLSLFRLHARSLWHILTGREGGLSLWSSNEVESGRSYPIELSLE